MTKLDAKIPEGSITEKWNNYKAHSNLVNPSNRRKLDVIIVGTGLAGAAAAASLGEAGYNVKAFYFQDSPRRAHSIAAQGGINASKNAGILAASIIGTGDPKTLAKVTKYKDSLKRQVLEKAQKLANGPFSLWVFKLG